LLIASASIECNPAVELIFGSKGIIMETHGKFSGMSGYWVFVNFGFIRVSGHSLCNR
jgi:hypothetical protein